MTVMVQDADFEESAEEVAVTTAVPSAIAVTSPASSTKATSALELLHVTPCGEPSGRTEAES